MDKPTMIAGLEVSASATVTRGPETLRRIAAGELNPDGTPVSAEGSADATEPSGPDEDGAQE